MSWSELERLVEAAEADSALRRALRHCRSSQELVLAGQRLGFAINLADLRRARQLEHLAAADPQAVAG
jgi:predicted ribosomally synthesized peptide with nif11-like leader